MSKSIIAEGKTTNEAISNGLKELHVSKEKVDIKILESGEKRSFFSILSPRVVKVELTIKEETEKKCDKVQRNVNNCSKRIFTKEKEELKELKEIKKEDIDTAKTNVENFLADFSKKFEDICYKVEYGDIFLNVSIDGKSSSKLIGYRGDVLNSLQTILNSIANKNVESKVRVILNISQYKERRKVALEELADKISKTVLKNGKTVTLEPMMAYERKIIHNRLQSNHRIRTYSIGDEPYRKVVISKK